MRHPDRTGRRALRPSRGHRAGRRHGHRPGPSDRHRRVRGRGTGLLYAYDEPGEFFWVAPFDAALDPGSPLA
ncbi:hypothetical protein ACU686_11770 [Yinghuangia aomiensis]